MLPFSAVAASPITPDEVRRIARLAHLDLDEEQIAVCARQLGAMLAYFEQMKQLDTDGVDPTFHVLDLANAFRPDEIRPSLPRESVLSQAPAAEAGLFKVPRVI